MKSLADVLGEVIAIRGVLAAAVVSTDGEVLAGLPADSALLERMTGTVTGALAAGVALATLVARDDAVGLEGSGSTDEETVEVGDGTGTDWPAFDADGDGSAAAGPVEGPQSLRTDGSAVTGKQLMVIYEDTGPIVFTPLPGGERVVVVGLRSAQDLGRARFQLRGLTAALAAAEQLG